ncbi:hypothetical protein [Desulfovibrio cuneatus]|uniref:hypothetical protein n=1 Tax=Desulfovibrio cuneatus TaxID=159728 RepID=UPI00041E112D|nr:hypothetical protein [Desulfovibrio cuneatus]
MIGFPKSPLPPIVVPEPETLAKYGVLTMRLLRMARRKAKEKGREHKKRMVL